MRQPPPTAAERADSFRARLAAIEDERRELAVTGSGLKRRLKLSLEADYCQKQVVELTNKNQNNLCPPTTN